MRTAQEHILLQHKVQSGQLPSASMLTAASTEQYRALGAQHRHVTRDKIQQVPASIRFLTRGPLRTWL